MLTCFELSIFLDITHITLHLHFLPFKRCHSESNTTASNFCSSRGTAKNGESCWAGCGKVTQNSWCTMELLPRGTGREATCWASDTFAMMTALTDVLKELPAQDYKDSLAKKSLIIATMEEIECAEALTTVCEYFSQLFIEFDPKKHFPPNPQRTVKSASQQYIAPLFIPESSDIPRDQHHLCHLLQEHLHTTFLTKQSQLKSCIIIWFHPHKNRSPFDKMDRLIVEF